MVQQEQNPGKGPTPWQQCPPTDLSSVLPGSNIAAVGDLDGEQPKQEEIFITYNQNEISSVWNELSGHVFETTSVVAGTEVITRVSACVPRVSKTESKQQNAV